MQLSSRIPRTVAAASTLAFFHICAGNAMALTEDRVDKFLSSDNTDFLPPGAYIATGLASVTEFAQFLDKNPAVEVKQLLLSDSSIWDMENNYGFLDVSKYHSHSLDADLDVDDLSWSQFGRCNDDLDVPDEEADAVAHNTKLSRKQRRSLRDHPAVLDRILNRSHTSLETFSYLLYIENHRGYYCQTRQIPNEKNTRLFNRDFPRLKDLTVKGSSVWDPLEQIGRQERELSEAVEDAQRDLWKIPSLRTVTHLHVIGSHHMNDGERSLSSYRAQFKNLTHIRVTDSLPSEFRTRYVKIASSWGMLKAMFGGPSYEPVPRIFPENLTVIVQPNFYPMLNDWQDDCGTPGAEYNGLIHELDSMQDQNVHLSWPIREDWLKYKWQGLYPVERAISNFVEHISGGDGEWKVGEELIRETPREWWWKFDVKRNSSTHEEL
ncbi:hypothetical protein EV361DRAFT_930541 [Lentinula raphanica]|nr:hypothetical protein F5880DRAFT_1008858 [Lentinula raphanica]KAJ3967453.1 hypothetical protein EV361DRAFT_930541 [Lentinula raphanica]